MFRPAFQRSDDGQIPREQHDIIFKILQILRRSHPMTDSLNIDFRSELFDMSNIAISSAIILYLLKIIDRESCCTLVPVNPVSVVVFYQGVINFFARIVEMYPWISIDGKKNLRTILRTRKGPEFAHFIFQTCKIALKVDLLKNGIHNLPSAFGANELEEKLAIMVSKEKKYLSELLLIKSNTPKIEESLPSNLELLDKLRRTEEDLQKRVVLPKRFKDLPLKAAVCKWTEELERAMEVQDTTFSNLRDSWDHIFRDPPIVKREDLVGSQNEDLLRKIAAEHKIPLFVHNSVSLPGFLECASIATEKFIQLIAKSPLYQKGSNELESTSSENADNASLIEIISVQQRNSMEALENNLLELKEQYCAAVAARGGHRFRFPGKDHNLQAARNRTPESNLDKSVTWSPADSSIELAIENAKLKLSEEQQCGTPKKTHSSSYSLARSVLQRQSCTPGSQNGNSIIGEMIPASSSSPYINAVHCASLSPFGEISALDDTVSLDQSSPFDEQSVGCTESGFVDTGLQENTADCSTPKGRSIDNVIERYKKLKRSMSLTLNPK